MRSLRDIGRPLTTVAAGLLVLLGFGAAFAAPPEPPAPPVAAKHAFAVASPNGTRNDDYYWLRDDKRQAPEVLGYLNAENAYRDAVMAPLRPLEEQLYTELTQRLKPDDSSVPVLEHGYWYYRRFEPGRDYPVYARRRGSLTAPEEVLLDGNAMAAGHEFFQIGSMDVSPDGRLLAYTEDLVGRRQYVLHVKDLATGRLRRDRILNVEPGVVWAADNRTLLYVEKDPVTLLSVRVRRHTLGQAGAHDPLVYEEKDHSYYMGLRKSRSERLIFIALESTLQTEWRYAEAADPKLRFRPVRPREPNLEYQVEQLGDDFVIRTNWQAPNFRIVRVPMSQSADKEAWRDVVPHRADALIEDFEVGRELLAVNERSGGLLKLRLRSWDGRRDTLVESGEPAYAMHLVETPDIDSPSVRYVYSSLTTPNSTFDVDVHSGARELRKVDEVLGGFDAANYATEFLLVPARDGKRVPVSLAYRKGTRLDGSAPLYQYGYGSYGISMDPTFRSSWVSLMDRGFVVAIAHVRGGQELGRAWYEDGRLLYKKNTFTDFIDVTEALVRRGYAARDKVFASGGSAGGLLMGAVANMAPKDYRGVIAHVPFVDVVTTMLDDSIPLTANEYDQWGNPHERLYYDYMLSYSPYDQVVAQDYPAMLVFTGLWDSQVQYYEPAKWVAKLRALKTDHHSLVFSIDMSAGHGGKPGRFQRYRDTAREYAFILGELGVAH
ncbi:MAG: S9 family peptidase [Proteobacteria bacterium]|nr:S9 family peptidase [Pseudomonadota bacterium]